MQIGLTEDYVEDANEHLYGTSPIIFIDEYSIARNHVSIPNCGECDKSEVAGGGEVPVLPDVEQDCTQHDVKLQQCQVDDNWYIQLRQYKVNSILRNIICDKT